MTCANYVKAYWRLLLVRWAMFTLVLLLVAFVTKQDLRTIWPIALIGAGLLNIAWIWVA